MSFESYGSTVYAMHSLRSRDGHSKRRPTYLPEMSGGVRRKHVFRIAPDTECQRRKATE